MARCFVTRRIPGPALDKLEQAHEVEVWPHRLPPTPEELRAHAADKEGLLTLLTDAVDEELLAAAPELRALSN
jgi:glyoxylate reductase